MTRDEAVLLARELTERWPETKWTPPLLRAWEHGLETVTPDAATRASSRLHRGGYAPTFAAFVAAARPDQNATNEPGGLDIAAHKAAIADLRARHKFINQPS